MNNPIRYGLIGCGGFGRFSLRHYRLLESLRPVAVADVNPTTAREVAMEFGLEAVESAEELIARPDIDIIHLATPPGTHYRLALAALEQGKHVLCEKPLALTKKDAAEMIDLAASRGLVLAVNLIMRYNPLNTAVHNICHSDVLGCPLFASLINLAQDEILPATHWFWNRTESGAIFVEHGVHFFDLFEWWFGHGRIVNAQQISRPGTSLVDQVHCVARYGDLTLGTFYHGFHQSLRQDRQDWEIVFEKGVIRMSEWVPTRLEADVFLTREDLSVLQNLLPDSQTAILEMYEGDRRQAYSRHRPRTMDLHAAITCNPKISKDELYGRMIRDLMSDQIAAIRNPGHQRMVTEVNGLSSLAYAVDAQAFADTADQSP